MPQQYQVLARKYRPKNFHELVGQSHVSKALINAIDHNRLHHAYLFTGTRGVGKTTIARILSKCLNCETGVTSTPCGVCSSCVAIDQGRFIDLIEIDAASRTKVEDTRELIDNVPYAPTQGRYKVYLIDEVHMLSTHSFNALLKTLEEPPAHVKFLLATTDPQKLPITIISRCLQFVLRPLPQQAISEHIGNLLTLEGINYTQPALWQLANAAKGSVRDALSLTDQAIAFGQGELTDETVNDMLGLIDNADLVMLLLDIYHGNTEAVATHIEQMRAQMVDAGSMFDGLAELLHQVAMLQLLPNVALDVNDKQAEQIKHLANSIGADVLQLYYQIVTQGREQIKLANTPLQALEMCLLRLLAFRPLAINEVPIHSQTQTVLQSTDDKTLVDDTLEEQHPDTSQQVQSEHSTPNTSRLATTNEDEIDPPFIEDDSIAVSSELDIAVSDNTQINEVDTEDYGHNQKKAEQQSDFAEIVQGSESQPEFITKQQLSEPPTAFNEMTESFALAEAEAREQESRQEVAIHPVTSKDKAGEDDSQSNSSSMPIPASEVPLSPIADEDPRILLKCPPMDLEGDWTPEKWDYWLQSARESATLGHDQLAMARQGVMTGSIAGKSVFKVAFDTKNMQSIFKHLANHLGEQFGAEVSIEVDPSLTSDNEDLLPQNRQKLRQIKAEDSAKKLITQSLVMQRLIHDSRGEIVHLRLLTDSD